MERVRYLSTFRGKDQRNDQTVQAEHLRENEDQDHANEQTGLLCRTTHTRITNYADRISSSQTTKADTKSSTKLI